MDRTDGNLSRLEATEILSITEPELLFSGTVGRLKAQYRFLVARWHPDICRDPRASTVIAHIAALRKEAEEKLASGEWRGGGSREIRDRQGRLHQFRYLVRDSFELGEILIGRGLLAYFLCPERAALGEAALGTVANLPFASEAMRREATRFLPEVIDDFTAKDGRRAIVLRKSPGYLRLRDALRRYARVGFPAEWPRHVAWIISRLLGICCYLDYAALVHNEISPDSVRSTSWIIGGWRK